MGHMLKALLNWCFSVVHAKKQYFSEIQNGTDASPESEKDLSEVQTFLGSIAVIIVSF